MIIVLILQERPHLFQKKIALVIDFYSINIMNRKNVEHKSNKRFSEIINCQS